MRHLDKAALQAYLDWELSASAQDRAEIHLAGCVGCREKLAALRQAHAEVRTRLTVLIPDRIPASLPRLTPAGAEPAKTPFRFWQWFFSPIRIPAGVFVLMGAACLILAGLWYSKKSSGNTNGTPLPVSPGPSLTMILPEGEVRLSFGFSPQAFKPVQNPIIFKEIEP
jgi:hypothetical protein